MSFVLNSLAILCGAYVVAVIGMYLLQDKLIFPRGIPANYEPSQAQLAGMERVEIQSADGQTLAGIRSNPIREDKPLVLGFGGNAQNAAWYGSYLQRLLPNYNVAIFYYRGYGYSEGKPSQKALYKDALTIYDSMKDYFDAEQVATVGVSIGTSVATYLAAHREVDLNVLVMPFDSLAKVAQRHYPWLPVKFLVRHEFPSVKYAPQVETPVAIIQANGEQTVPNESTDKLAAAFPNLIDKHGVDGSSHVALLDDSRFDKWLFNLLETQLQTPAK